MDQLDDLSTAEERDAIALSRVLVDTVKTTTRNRDVALTATFHALLFVLINCADMHESTRIVTDALIKAVDDIDTSTLAQGTQLQ